MIFKSKRMLDDDVKHPFCHFIQYGWYFIRASSESLDGVGFLHTFVVEKETMAEWKAIVDKLNPIIYKRYEEDYDFVVDGSSCHNNQFCKE